MPRLSKIGAACLAAFGYTGITLIPASYVVVAGGGGAFNVRGGGGGAGGMLSGTTNLNPLLSYVVTIGAGGTGLLAGQSSGATAGVNSSIGSIATAIGGGVGSGGNGGSGGGASGSAGQVGGTGTAGQGNNGGSGVNYGSGGGGGAGAVGGNGTTSVSGNGGTGLANPITGSTSGQNVSGTYYFAGGGGGGHQTNLGGTRGLGGNGGGGNGGLDGTTVGADGSSNTGGGGGGGGGDGANYFKSGFGGSGIAIISYTSPTQLFGGGIVTFVGGNWIHTFTTSGTLVPASTFTANFLVVAGGGGGANPFITVNSAGGGGGGGGYRTSAGTSGGGSAAETALTLDVNSNYVVTVGSGGAGNTGVDQGGNGGNSSFFTITSIGGGGGGRQSRNGAVGGSGGGDCGTGIVAAGTANQGYAGGIGVNGLVQGAAGGGGAGAVGGNTAGTGAGGAGGAGVASTITGTSVVRAGGGGGGGSGAGGAAGNGGGGFGGSGAAGGAGTANTGGGAGGSYGNITGQNGGSGVVIISYAGTQRMAGGTVTFVGGNTIHTFTSSGYLSALKLVNNSLRFKASTSSYLNRTLTTATNSAKWTWSSWLKIGGIPTYNPIFAAGTTGSAYAALWFNNGALVLYAYTGATIYQLTTASVYRDPAAWYHVQIAYDSTQATASDRVKIYINGVQITAFTTATYPTLNYATYFNTAVVHNIGQYTPAGVGYFDGYMTEINFVDGQQLTPSSFGGYNSFGVWQPCQYLGSFGNNGFYLPFTNNASSTTIGYDFSPNGKNWTATGFTLTPTTSAAYDSMTDVPTLTSTTASNFCVMNAVSSYSGLPVISGNIQTSAVPSGANWFSRSATIGVSNGKWYAEFSVPSITAGAQGNPIGFGIIPSANDFTAIGQQVGNPSFGYGFYCPDTTGSTPKKIVNNVTTAVGTGTATTTSDVFMVAFDLTNGNAWFGKNGTWYAGDPSAGTGASITGITAGEYLFALSIYRDTTYTNNTAAVNFGQRPFSYSLPTNYLALNTFNM